MALREPAEKHLQGSCKPEPSKRDSHFTAYKGSIYKAETGQVQLPVKRAAELVSGLVTFLRELVPPDFDTSEATTTLAPS